MGWSDDAPETQPLCSRKGKVADKPRLVRPDQVAMALSPYVQAMQDLFRANTRSREFPAHGAKVHSVAWSCCGRRLASGSFDKTASVFVLDKDRLVSARRKRSPRGRGEVGA